MAQRQQDEQETSQLVIIAAARINLLSFRFISTAYACIKSQRSVNRFRHKGRLVVMGELHVHLGLRFLSQ